MLVLTRRFDEELIMHDQKSNTVSRIRLVDIGHGQVKLGVSAPGHVIVDREEVYKQRMSNKQVVGA